MPKALILGHNGQDGTYLSQQLRQDGYEVIGVGRANRAAGYQVDITSGEEVHALLATVRPDEIYHLAAFHHSSRNLEIGYGTLVDKSIAINTLSLNHVLSGVQQRSPESRVFYAASSRVFGVPATITQNEDTPFRPACAYGISKAAAINLCQYYRNFCGVYVASGILYNHESPLRSHDFVSKRIAVSAVRIARGLEENLELGSLSNRVDWGYAPDYTYAMRLILAQKEPSDYIVGTGTLHSVQDFVEIAFRLTGRDWRRYVSERANLLNQALPNGTLCADSSKLRRAVGWKPTVDFERLVEIMVRAEMEAGSD